MEPEHELNPAQAVATMEPRQPWDKRPDESQRAFGAFCLYRDAEKRSFKRVADQLKCSPQNIFQWSSKYNWRGRCDAFDIEQDRLQREELARGRVRMRERHLRLAVAMQGIAAHAVREWQIRVEQGLALNLAPEQIALLTKCGVELERATVGVKEVESPMKITVLFQRGDGSVATAETIEREEYAQLDEAERAAWRSWKNPPLPPEAEDG